MTEGWLGAVGDERPTRIGNLDSPVGAAVDRTGLVAIDGLAWSLDWWIGAEDRWHVPAREAAVRQQLLRGSPVVETRVRVPSGDAVHRAYGARGAAGEDVVVVEIHNDSTIPFAVALALRPYALDGQGGLGSVRLDGHTVAVDGADALRLPRSPGRVALSTGEGGDAASTVFGGAAGLVGDAAVACRDDLATAALLFPLAHTATLRVVLTAPGGRLAAPDAVPSAEQVASGWATQSAVGARFEVPERRLRDGLAASTRHLLLAAAGPVDAEALDLLGFHWEAARLLAEGRSRAGGPPGQGLAALARHWSLSRDAVFASAVVAEVAALVPALARTDPADREVGLGALAVVADLLSAAGEPAGATDARALARPGSPVAADPAGDLRRLVDAASPTWTWAQPDDGPAALVRALRGGLLRDEPDGLSLAPAVPEAWLGQGWEVHDAPTAHGRLSYAIRWHGDRPALLWELAPHDAAGAVRLAVPVLDPAWSSTEPRGEALLAPVPVPARPSGRRGLSIPVAIAPRPGGLR